MGEPMQPKEHMRHVLIVEDDHELADLLREVLVYENCLPDVAGNGMEALEKLRTADFEAVICDLMMPRVDGEAFYKEAVRQYPYLSDRFLFITGQMIHRAGLADFISRTGNILIEKPFEMEQLRAALRDLFQR
jgi:DNA-binding response OmpR family regulator